jgi:4-hydroxybenzoate polyprenyltransferase
MLGGQIVVGVVNEVVDAPVDTVTKPEKPIPAGVVSRRGAVGLGVVGLVVMLAFGATFGGWSLLLLAVGNGLGVAYSLWFKRTRFAWLPYLLALPLLPVWVAVSVDAFEAALLWLYPLGAMGVLAVQLAQSVPDIEADRAAGIESVTTRLGERGSLWACWGLLGGTVLLVLAGALLGDWASGWLVGGGVAVLALVVLNMLVYRKSPRGGVLAAFPCSAISTGLLALAWVAGVS